MIIGLLEEYGKFKYLCVLILFLLKILEKLVLFMYGVIFMWGRDTDDIIRELFRSFLHNYQEELEMIKGSEFIFESVKLMDYKLHRLRLRRGGSYTKSREWLLQKGAAIPQKIKMMMNAYDGQQFLH